MSAVIPSVRFSLPYPARPTALRPDSPFGLNLQMEARSWSVPEMRAAVRFCAAAGIRWSREEFHWHHLMPTRGRFRWRRMDSAVDLTLQHGISIMGIVAYWAGPWDNATGPDPGWADAYNPAGIRDYCRLLRACVRRYKDRVHCWQIWNEPNGRYDKRRGKDILRGFWKGTPAQYADMLRAGYETCKEEDPDCTVVGFNMALCDLEWAEALFADGLLEYADVVSFHPYRWLQAPEDQADALAAHCFDRDYPTRWMSHAEEAQALRALISRYTTTPKPLWVTELSWHAALNHASLPELEAAQYMARGYLSLLGPGGVDKLFWYDLREPSVGLATPALMPRYFAAAVATLSQVLEGKRFAAAYEIGPGNYAHLWRGAEQDTLALWTTCPTPQFAQVQLSDRSDWQLVDLFGVPHSKSRLDRTDPLLIPLGRGVRYLITPPGSVREVTQLRQFLYELPRNHTSGHVPEDPYRTVL